MAAARGRGLLRKRKRGRLTLFFLYEHGLQNRSDLPSGVLDLPVCVVGLVADHERHVPALAPSWRAACLLYPLFHNSQSVGFTVSYLPANDLPVSGQTYPRNMSYSRWAQVQHCMNSFRFLSLSILYPLYSWFSAFVSFDIGSKCYRSPFRKKLTAFLMCQIALIPSDLIFPFGIIPFYIVINYIFRGVLSPLYSFSMSYISITKTPYKFLYLGQSSP